MRLPVILASLIPLLALQGCGDQNALASDISGELRVADAGSNESMPRLFGEENFTVVYSVLESSSVSRTEYVRDWGRRRSEIFLGNGRIHMVSEDGRVWVSSSEVPGVFVNDDGFTANLLALMDSHPELSVGHRRMLLSGMSPTDRVGEIAGYACRYYRIANELSIGRVEACATDWGAVLYTKAKMPHGETMTIVASEVRIGDGGPDAAFAIDKANAQEADTL